MAPRNSRLGRAGRVRLTLAVLGTAGAVAVGVVLLRRASSGGTQTPGRAVPAPEPGPTVEAVVADVPARAARSVWRTLAAVAVATLCLGLPWWVPQMTTALVPGPAIVVPTRPVPTLAVAALAGDAHQAVEAAAPRAQQAAPVRRLAAAGPPVRVRVPRLGVNSPVVPISGQSGVLTPPDDPRVLGWWREGRQPGAARGATVVTGHTVHTGGGALDELGTLRRGDTFTVVTKRGTIRYRVDWQRDYPTADLARRAAQLFSLDNEHRLLLITCSGWNGRGYDKSAVASARPLAVRDRDKPPQGRRPAVDQHVSNEPGGPPVT